MDDRESDEEHLPSPEEDEVDVAVDEVIDRILEAWVNEKFAPDLLPSKMDLAESLLCGLQDIRGGLDSSSNDNFLANIQEMELDRINYLITSYLRARLKKIEALHIYINSNKDVLANLSEKEAKYAHEFDKLSSELLQSVVKEMPTNIQSDNRKNVPQKNLDSFVFFEVVKELVQVVFESDDEPMDLEVGSRHLMKYSLLVPLLLEGSIKLI